MPDWDQMLTSADLQFLEEKAASTSATTESIANDVSSISEKLDAILRHLQAQQKTIEDIDSNVNWLMSNPPI
jgi:hypothetical protein